MDRPPRGLAFLATYYAVLGVGLVAATWYAINVLRPIPEIVVRILANPDAALGVAAAVAVVLGLTAYGLWTLRPWARPLVVGVSVLGIAAGMLTLPFGFVSVMLNIVTFWYITSPRVRVAFGKPSYPPPIR